jgi:hypothetical protein
LTLWTLLGEALMLALVGPCVVVMVISPLLAANRFKAEAAETAEPAAAAVAAAVAAAAGDKDGHNFTGEALASRPRASGLGCFDYYLALNGSFY